MNDTDREKLRRQTQSAMEASATARKSFRQAQEKMDEAVEEGRRNLQAAHENRRSLPDAEGKQ